MKKLITYKFIFIILTLNSITTCFGQSNSYFENNESWAGTSWWTNNQNSFYVQQQGDTVINNDTLVKLIKVDDNNWIDTTYYLAKNDTGVLNMYYSSSYYTPSNDTIVIDYSRTDSITCYKSINQFSVNLYYAWPISSVDTLYFNGIPKKIFSLVDNCSNPPNDYVYEGTFNIEDQPYFGFCFETADFLECYSINDTNYYVNENNFYYNQLGSCVISNLSVNENIAPRYNVYPNPVTDNLNIETSLTNKVVGGLFSIDGTKIMAFGLKEINNQINLTGISAGIYLLTITSDGVKGSYKIIKL